MNPKKPRAGERKPPRFIATARGKGGQMSTECTTCHGEGRIPAGSTGEGGK